jgi:hypothetical protein
VTSTARIEDLLRELAPQVLGALNRAVAAAMVHGPQAGLDLLAPLEERLPGHYRLDAVRGHLLEMRGDAEAAAAHYRAAAARTTSEPERQYLITKAARLNKQNREYSSEVRDGHGCWAVVASSGWLELVPGPSCPAAVRGAAGAGGGCLDRRQAPAAAPDPCFGCSRADQSGCDRGCRRPKTKYEIGTTPAELTTVTTVAHNHFGPRTWLAGRRLRSMSAASLRMLSATAVMASSLRVRSLRSLHCLLPAMPSSAYTGGDP